MGLRFFLLWIHVRVFVFLGFFSSVNADSCVYVSPAQLQTMWHIPQSLSITASVSNRPLSDILAGRKAMLRKCLFNPYVLFCLRPVFIFYKNRTTLKIILRHNTVNASQSRGNDFPLERSKEKYVCRYVYIKQNDSR